MNKTFSKLLATAAALSIITSAAAVVNADDTTTVTPDASVTTDATAGTDASGEAATTTTAASDEAATTTTAASDEAATTTATTVASGEAATTTAAVSDDAATTTTTVASEEATTTTTAVSEEAAADIKVDGIIYGITEAGAIVKGVEAGAAAFNAETGAITVPDAIEVKAAEGETPAETAAVVGIADLAFVSNDLAITKINLPASLKKDQMSDLALLTKSSIEAYFEAELGKKVDEVKEEDLVAYVAKKFEYNGKTEKFTEEELAEVKAKMDAKAKLAGVTEDMKLVDAIVAIIKNEDKMGLAEKTAEKFDIWTKTITMDVTVSAPAGSEIEEYLNGKAALGLKVELGLAGDANGDGVVNVRDAAAIAFALANSDLSTIVGNGDFNADGVVNVRDAAAIAAALANGELNK